MLYNFRDNARDGVTPLTSLVLDSAGNLYGTASTGGIHTAGTVFELTPQAGGDWTEKVLYSFDQDSQDNADPSGLIFDSAGNLYGTTANGAPNDVGTVFKLTRQAGGGWAEKVLYSFNYDGKDGAYPYAGLVLDGAGNLYGTTFDGCTHGVGTVFELTPQAGGGWTESVLYSFGNGTDGAYPQASLILDGAGNLYGTTANGGTDSVGTVFELTPQAGGGWMENVLYSFGDTA